MKILRFAQDDIGEAHRMTVTDAQDDRGNSARNGRRANAWDSRISLVILNEVKNPFREDPSLTLRMTLEKRSG